MSSTTHISKRGNDITVCKLSINDLMTFFEEGLLCHFESESWAESSFDQNTFGYA